MIQFITKYLEENRVLIDDIIEISEELGVFPKGDSLTPFLIINREIYSNGPHPYIVNRTCLYQLREHFNRFRVEIQKYIDNYHTRPKKWTLSLDAIISSILSLFSSINAYLSIFNSLSFKEDSSIEEKAYISSSLDTIIESYIDNGEVNIDKVLGRISPELKKIIINLFNEWKSERS